MAGLKTCEPIGYNDFVTLMSAARLVATDSGGIQEETDRSGGTLPHHARRNGATDHRRRGDEHDRRAGCGQDRRETDRRDPGGKSAASEAACPRAGTAGRPSGSPRRWLRFDGGRSSAEDRGGAEGVTRACLCPTTQ